VVAGDLLEGDGVGAASGEDEGDGRGPVHVITRPVFSV
jgi:hypothetical protein